MKRLSLPLLILLLVGMVHCGPPVPWCEGADQEDQKLCAEASVLFTMMLLQNRTSPGQTTGPQTVNFTQESAFQTNDTFATAQALPSPAASTVQAISGRVNTESDVDIYYLSYTSGTSPSLVIDVSKPGTTGVCAMYTSFGESALNSALPDGSLLSLGTISAAATPVVLDRFSRTHLYLRCSGIISETYTVRLGYSSLNVN